MSVLDPLLAPLLQEADKLLLGLFENAQIGVYLIQDDRFAYVNQTFAGFFGYSQRELCAGLAPMDLTSPEFRTRARREIDRRISGRSHASLYRFLAVRKDGSSFDAEVFGVATSLKGRPAIIGTFHDISQRMRAERELADQLQFVAGLVETMPNPVFYKGVDGRYLGCNKAYETYIGIPRGDLIGRTVFELWNQELAECYHAADQALYGKPGTQVYESAVETTEGERREVIFYKASFNRSDGGLGGLVGIILDISERKRMEQQIWREAHYDALTGLPNRRLFEERMPDYLEAARRDGGRLALMFVDLDRFKEVNDVLGHRIGDLLLVEAGRRIGACLREGDLVARQGGDEFIVALNDLVDPGAATSVADRIIDVLSRPFELARQFAYVSASVGIALYPDDAESIDRLLSFADQAMYLAKERGRNGYCSFVPAYQEEARKRNELANDLRHALAQGELEVHFQPIVRLDSGAVVKAEALLRWRHPTRGMIPPDTFIPLAEEINLIGEIGDWVFFEAAREVGAWNAERAPGAPPLQVSVNKSPRQILFGDSHETWLEHLERERISPDFVAVEITEGILLENRPEVVEKLGAFRDAGVHISLDDFGTGYSSMAYLKKFAIDILKIDRSFVSDMDCCESDRAIAEAIIAMAHRLGIRVVAEGVENAAQCALLAAAGCDYAQGYHFARPMPAQAFRDYLREEASGAAGPARS